MRVGTSLVAQHGKWVSSLSWLGRLSSYIYISDNIHAFPHHTPSSNTLSTIFSFRSDDWNRSGPDVGQMYQVRAKFTQDSAAILVSPVFCDEHEHWHLRGCSEMESDRREPRIPNVYTCFCTNTQPHTDIACTSPLRWPWRGTDVPGQSQIHSRLFRNRYSRYSW